VGPRAGLDGCRKSRPLREIARNAPVNTKLVHTMGERAMPMHEVYRYKQDVERPCRQRTLKPGLIIIIIIIILVRSLQFLRLPTH